MKTQDFSRLTSTWTVGSEASIAAAAPVRRAAISSSTCGEMHSPQRRGVQGAIGLLCPQHDSGAGQRSRPSSHARTDPRQTLVDLVLGA